MHKKISKLFINIAALYVISVIFAEIVNFIYITPFISLFFFFEAALLFAFYDRNWALHASFVFGIISDIIALHDNFIFTFALPFAVYLADNVRFTFQFSRYPMCLFFYFVYAAICYRVWGVPLFLIGLLLIFTYLFCLFTNHILTRINLRKIDDGKEG